MGYPMTFQRVLNRNGLADGDYVNSPQRHAKNVNTDATTGTAGEDSFKIAIFPHLAQRVDGYEQAFKMLAGDLRRLEQDAVDENPNGVCGHIARQTGLEMEVVAMVLKEFTAW